jgi:hypothetical protein
VLIVSERPYELAQLARVPYIAAFSCLAVHGLPFIEGNEAKFCDRADLVAGTSVSPGAEKTLATPIVVSLVLFGVPSFLWMVGPQPVSNDWLWIGQSHLHRHQSCLAVSPSSILCGAPLLEG